MHLGFLLPMQGATVPSGLEARCPALHAASAARISGCLGVPLGDPQQDVKVRERSHAHVDGPRVRTRVRFEQLVGQLSARWAQATQFRAFHPHLRPLGEQKPRPHKCHAKFVFTLLGLEADNCVSSPVAFGRGCGVRVAPCRRVAPCPV